jgi:hypothetical protein
MTCSASKRGSSNIGVAFSSEQWQVKERQRVQQHVAVAKSPRGVQRLGIRAQVAMSERGALGLAGGTGGVEDGRDIVVPGRKGLEYIPRVIGGHQAPVAGRAQRHRLVDTTVAREPGDHLVILGPAHHHPGPRIAEEML